MQKIFNESFFRFLLGFVVIISFSFLVTFAIDYYAGTQYAASDASTGALQNALGIDWEEIEREQLGE